MDKTRDEMSNDQRILLSYLESLVPKDDVLMGIVEFQSSFDYFDVPDAVYVAKCMLSNAEITNVLHELTRPF